MQVCHYGEAKGNLNQPKNIEYRWTEPVHVYKVIPPETIKGFHKNCPLFQMKNIVKKLN
jgi:hypothetical protein